jgi:hypothetical protein
MFQRQFEYIHHNKELPTERSKYAGKRPLSSFLLSYVTNSVIILRDPSLSLLNEYFVS